MYCYRCNGSLDLRRDVCSKCGTDIRVFKKIVYTSNRYYNSALVKAHARNLTGAKDDLRQSLSLYKNNTNARNLLGLVYYAMGEPAEALKEWVISKNLTPESTVADRYINRMRHSVREMDSEGHGVKKLNQAINYVKNDARDLALIQLKKICSVHTNMTKAYNLLALLYIQDGKYEQAGKILKKCLAVDSGNTTAFRYLKEIEELIQQNGLKNVGTVGEEEREQLIIPVRFRDYGSYLANALYILLGLVLGILIAYFVIVPGRVQKEIGNYNDEKVSFEAQIGSLQEQVAILTPTEETEPIYSIEPSSEEDENTEPDVIERIPPRPAVNTSWSLNQDAVGQCVYTVNVPDFAATIRSFVTIDPKSLSQTNTEHYKNIAAALFDPGNISVMNESAASYFNKQMYGEAANYYDALALLFPENGTYKIQAGLSYENLGKRETAINRYWQAAVLYPDTEVGTEGRNRYLAMTQATEVPPVPEGTDIAAETAARPIGYYLDQMQ